MSRYNQKSVAHSDNSKSRGGPADTVHAAGGARRRALLLGTALAGTVALVPFTAQAATDTWNGTLSNSWLTLGNWSGGLPISTSAVVISSITNSNPVEIGSAGTYLLNGTTGALSIGDGVDSIGLQLDSGVTLNMGARPVTLTGGYIDGAGTLNSTGTKSGYGTFSAAETGNGTWSASVAGKAFTLTGGGAYGGTFASSSTTGFFNWNGVTLNSISTSGSSGTYNLNGATINGATLSNSGGEFYVLGNSTLTGTISFSQYNTFNIGGASGANTLNLGSATSSTTTALNTVTGGAAPFIIGTGGVLNDYNHAATMGGGTVNMQGGSITNTSGTGGTTAGLFTVGDPISGYGAVSGNVAITAGNLTAGVTGSAHTLTLNGGSGAGIVLGTGSSGPGMGTVGGGTLDLQGNISVASGANMNPGTGTILLDGMTLSNHNINNSGLTTSGTFKVVNASTLNNNAFSTGTGANLQVNALLNLTNGASLNVPATATINTGGTVNDYSGPITATIGTLNLNGGSLTNTSGSTGTAGAFTVTVSTDYTNANWGSGNSFDPTANVSGNTVIDAAGTGPFQAITGGSALTGGGTTTPTLALGAVHVGSSTSESFAIKNIGTSDPSLRGAVQTTGLTGGEVSLAGGAQNFGPIVSGASTSPYTVTFSATSAGALTGQSIAVVSNFANVPTQTVGLTGAAYHYADPVWSKTGGAGSFSGSGNAYTLDFGTLHNGVTSTADLQILNQLYADDPTGAFTDLLDGSFTTNVVKGAAFNLTGFGSFSGVAAGGTVDQTVSYDHHGAPYGLYEEIITFTPTSYDMLLGDFDACADHARCAGDCGARGGHHHDDAGRFCRHLPHRNASPAQIHDRDGPLTSRGAAAPQGAAAQPSDSFCLAIAVKSVTAPPYAWSKRHETSSGQPPSSPSFLERPRSLSASHFCPDAGTTRSKAANRAKHRVAAAEAHLAGSARVCAQARRAERHGFFLGLWPRSCLCRAGIVLLGSGVRQQVPLAHRDHGVALLHRGEHLHRSWNCNRDRQAYLAVGDFAARGGHHMGCRDLSPEHAAA